ncbi:unnamed protein product [Phytophthora fragariaefolia]|uniref:Unnamed protein product n=1 Tax=Phytophthora fragariaefolia TaxID=1490495 RepID=A0A9W6TU73_9STRA|nr:unnamed protein product [Phytophthora fragariaefolia]
MPEVENLSWDLTRFTKEMLGRVSGSFRDNVTPLSTHLVIHRVRRHVEHLISICAHSRESYWDSGLPASEKRFVNVFMQTQMFQKYQDDQPITSHSSIEQSNHQEPIDQSAENELPLTIPAANTQYDGLKSAASVLFQIALAGVSALPQNTSRTSITTKTVYDLEIDMKKQDDMLLPTMDGPELASVKLSSTASSPTARIFSNLKHSPNEKTESPTRGHELLSPTLSEQSAQADRQSQTFVWPLTQSEPDIFWVADEANIISPTSARSGSPQHLVLDLMNDIFESPRRSPNNESVTSPIDEAKSATRSERGSIVNAQRADTDTTISIFDMALSGALGSADTADDSWLFDTSDGHILNSHHDNHSEEDRETNPDSSVEEYDTSSPLEVRVKDDASERNSPGNSPQRSWHRSISDQNDDQTQDLDCQGARGAWEGWCEGKMFVSPDFTTLTWERRAVAFAALNMKTTDMTKIELQDASLSDTNQRQIQLTFGSEAIHFQFSKSSHHDAFFSALQHLIWPTQDRDEGRNESFSSVQPVLTTSSQDFLSSPRSEEEQIAEGDRREKASLGVIHEPPAQQETDIDQFKRKLQRGFLVEKPHSKLIFTDALCSHIMWRKPPPTGADPDQLHDQPHHRSNFFSQAKGIPVDSITDIVTGKQTTVFRRASASKSDDRVCLSILTPTRTLDMCAYSLQDFQELYRGFSLLLEDIKRKRDGLQ